MTIKPNDEKLCELILYIAERSQNDPHFGATKLNKLLFYADFIAYRTLGRPITGHVYQKLEHGPAPRCLIPVLERMKEHDEVATQTKKHFGHSQTRTVALRSADCSVFDGREVAIINDVMAVLRDKNAKEVSDKSHHFHGWKLAEIGEDIPYSVALVGSRNPNQSEREYGMRLAGVGA